MSRIDKTLLLRIFYEKRQVWGIVQYFHAAFISSLTPFN
jgi:hypothetical protein